MVSWLLPGGWLLLEGPDFGMWLADSDPLWALHPQSWRRAFPNGSLSRGRMEAIGPAAVATGALTAEQATQIAERPHEPDFRGCGFVHIGVWGRRAAG